MASGAKISAARQAKGKRSGSAAWNRMGPKKDRHVQKSSHGKFASVAELVAVQAKSEANATGGRKNQAAQRASQLRAERALANSGGFSDVLDGKQARVSGWEVVGEKPDKYKA